MNDGYHWPEGMRAGFLLAGRLAGATAQEEALSALPEALRDELEGDPASGRELAQRVRRRPTPSQLEDPNQRASTLLASALPKRERMRHGSVSPRRAYVPPAGLLETLLAFPSEGDRAQDQARELATLARLIPQTPEDATR